MFESFAKLKHTRPTEKRIKFQLAMLMTYTRMFTTLSMLSSAVKIGVAWGSSKMKMPGWWFSGGEREEISILSGFPVYTNDDVSWHSPRSGIELVGSSLLMILMVLLGVGGGPIC